MRFGEKLARLVKEKGTNLAELARENGIPYKTIRGYLNPGSTRVPAAPTGVALARGLAVSIEWLFDDLKDWPPIPYHEPPPFEMVGWPREEYAWRKLRDWLIREQILGLLTDAAAFGILPPEVVDSWREDVEKRWTSSAISDHVLKGHMTTIEQLRERILKESNERRKHGQASRDSQSAPSHQPPAAKVRPGKKGETTPRKLQRER